MEGDSAEEPALTTFVALLRAINVGGTGKLPMSTLKSLCEDCGFTGVRTYIQSGNVVFASKLTEPSVKTKLAQALRAQLGKPVGVSVRGAAEMAEIVRRNPFPDAPGSKVLVYFLDARVSSGAIKEIAAPGKEQLEAHGREVFVHYPDGVGRSKLKLPFAAEATARNINTVSKLLAMMQAQE